MRIKELREFNNIQQKELASILEISPNTLSQYENNKREPSIDIVSKIADYFNVSADFVYGTSDITTCKKCGLVYVPLDSQDKAVHEQLHALWENAVKKYGKLYSNTVENERLKAENRNIVQDSTATLEERYNAQKIVFKCLFSRSLDASNYNEKHVDFSTYISMLLNQESTKRRLPPEIYCKFIKEYGKQTGIPNGETYYYPYNSNEYQTNEANLNNNEFTTIIKKYHALDDHGKEMVDFTLEKEYERSVEEKKHSGNVVSMPVKETSNYEVNAAHADDYMSAPDELKKLEEDIMDDENF